MKRVLSLVLAISMVMSMFTFSFAGSTLSDVKGTDYQSAVEALVELGIVNGYEDGTYRPEQKVSRAEMAKLLVIAAGLEAAAELNEGATRFADVNGGWASGYINVAAEYGYIMGDPDGNFRPDDTVSYAEAVTMALRVLGYKSVVEAKGTWPTNYIAKAEDLEMLEDITYTNYAEGAKRGNCAILIWNMLREEMWNVKGESDGDGLQYGKDEPMLNIKFPDYAYSKAEFVDFSIDKDGKVMIGLDCTYDNYTGSLEFGAYEYAGNDFYTFVEGTEVEVLVNEEDEVLLTIVPTNRDRIEDGSKADIDDEYDNLDNTDYDYAYVMIERRDVAEATLLDVTSEYVEEIKTTSTGIRINDKTYKDKTYEDAVVLIDGERASLRDVKEGDILSLVTVDGEEFFVVGSSKVEGKLTSYEADKAEVQIAGEKYELADAKYVEDPEDEDEQAKSFAGAEALFADMKNEEVVAHLDFIGRVVRIEFDGSIKDDDSEVVFGVITSYVEKTDNRRYVVSYETENGEQGEVMFSQEITSVAKHWNDFDGNLEGRFAMILFNDDGEINGFEILADSAFSGDATDLVNNNETVSGEDLAMAIVTNAKFDKDEKVLSGEGISTEIAVKSATNVISIVTDDKDTEGTTEDDTFEATYAKGAEAAKNIKGENVLVIYNKKTNAAVYVVRLDDSVSNDDKQAAKVETELNKLNKAGEYEVELDGEDYYLFDKENTLAASGDKYAYGVFAYTLKDGRKDGEDITKVNVLAGLTVDQLKDIAENVEDADVNTTVTEVDSEYDTVELANGEEFTFGPEEDLAKSYVDMYQNTLFVAIGANLNNDDDEVVESVSTKSFAELQLGFFEEDDFVLVYMNEDGSEAEVVFVISVVEVTEDNNTDAGDDEEVGEEEVETVTITWNVAGKTTTTDVALGEVLNAHPEAADDLAEAAGKTITGWATLGENNVATDADLTGIYAFADMTLYAKLAVAQPTEQQPE